MKGDLHVIPLDDLCPHNECAKCWCAPVVLTENGTRIVVHNSADEREHYETGVDKKVLDKSN